MTTDGPWKERGAQESGKPRQTGAKETRKEKRACHGLESARRTEERTSWRMEGTRRMRGVEHTLH